MSDHETEILDEAPSQVSDTPPAPDPRKGTMVTIAGVVVIALATAGLAVVIGNVRRVEPSPLDFAAARSIRTFRMLITTTGVGPDGAAFELTMDGAFDLERELLSITTTLGGAALAGQPELSFESIGTATHLFMKLPRELRVGFPSDREWIRAPLSPEVLAAFRQAGGVMGLPDDPLGFFEQLSSVATEVTEDGSEVVRGTQTTRYQLTLDVEQFVLSLPSTTDDDVRQALKEIGGETMPATIWIGEDGLPYRQTFDLAVASGTFTTVIEYFDYNERVQIELPAESQVADAPEGAFGEREASCTFTETGRAIGDGSDPQVQPSPSVSCSPSP